MIKPTKRKSFNFQRSYYDVFNELKEDQDKLEFLEAILNKQFLDQDPEGLNFLVNICYQGQRHFIESSVKGWKQATKKELDGTPLGPPTRPPTRPPRGGTPRPPGSKYKYKYKEEVVVRAKKTTPTKPYLKQNSKKGSNQDHIKSIVENQNEHATYLEAIYRRHRLEKGTLGKLLAGFELWLQEEEKEHPTEKEFKRHFSAWLNSQSGMGKLKQYMRH